VRGSTDALWSRVLPADAALAGWTAVRLDETAARAFLHGQAVHFDERAPGPGGLVRVQDGSARLLGVGEVAAAGDRVRPLRILHVDRPGTRVLPA